MLGLSLVQWLIKILVLFGIALPFLQVAHPRHARAFMGALIGLTTLWLVLYLLLRQSGYLGNLAPDNSNTVLLRGYVMSVALCTLLEEVLSLRDERKDVRLVVLLLALVFFVLALVCLIASVFTTF